MAYTGIDDNNDPTQNFSTGNGGSTDWGAYFKNYFDQQQQQQTQPQQQNNGGGVFRDGYGFNNTGNSYPQYNQQQTQVGQAGNYPSWPTGGFPSNQPTQQPTLGGNTGITGFLGPYGPQLQQSLDRYSNGLPRPGGVNPHLMGGYPGRT
jgi:hypothetical protein